MKLIVYNNKLYISTMDFVYGFDLYVTEDGVNFERILEDGYINSNYAYLWQMEEYNGRLYAGTFQLAETIIPIGSFALMSTLDGVDWIVEDTTGFGNPWYYVVRSMSVYDNKLIIGTASAQYGCKVFTAEAK